MKQPDDVVFRRTTPDDPHDGVSLMHMSRGEEFQRDADEQRGGTGAIVWALVGIVLVGLILAL